VIAKQRFNVRLRSVYPIYSVLTDGDKGFLFHNGRVRQHTPTYLTGQTGHRDEFVDMSDEKKQYEMCAQTVGNTLLMYYGSCRF
jgi:hypothetical protein